ncbi:hypothetical protein HaLaN_00437, partial [Haematococcus lacustris]
MVTPAQKIYSKWLAGFDREMNWWPEAFPCRAAFAAVGLATRNYFPGKHGVLGCFEDQHQTHTSPRVSQAAVQQGYQLLKIDANSKPPSPSLSKAAAA